jgi:lysozyme family protein
MLAEIAALLILSGGYPMAKLEPAFDKLMSDRYEGGAEYTDHPDDRGGPTRWGVTQATARAHGYTGDMRNFPKSKALEIADKSYWTPLRCNDMPQSIAFEVFEVGWHSGADADNRWEAISILQKSINIFLIAYQIDVDGKIGFNTMTALMTVLDIAGEKKLKMWFNIFQGVFYYEIAKANPSQMKFLRGGWTNRLEFK